MRICFLGTRSLDPQQESSLGLLLEQGGRRFLLDCGPYTVRSLRGLGLEPQDLDGLYVSHDHADHSGGLPWLVATWLLGGSRKPPSIILGAPHEKLAILDYLKVGYARLFADGNPRRIHLDKGPTAIGDLTIDYIPLKHAVETWGAVVRGDTGALGYFPDCIGAVLLETAASIGKIDSVVISVWGSSDRAEQARTFGFPIAGEAAAAATAMGASRLYVQHLNDPADQDAVSREIAEGFAGQVIFPEPMRWLE